ncbi:MAG: sugar phosphate isomerase/epimerase [Dehalococcoidia bacterium]|nr:MAG: sugar phosphate isomerase/epimerase [Dehalococcoidia bacterium]
MNVKLGVSTSICASEARSALKDTGRLSDEELVEGYLGLLEDFAGFAVEHRFELIEIEFGFSLIGADQLIPLQKQLKEIIRPFHTVCCHLPLGEINIAALNPEIRKASIAETKKHIDLCTELGISNLIMHPGSFAGMTDRYLLLAAQTRATAEQSVFEISSYCEQKYLELSLENLSCNEPLFQRPHEFETFIHKGIGMALDTLHAITSGVDPLDYISRFGRRITEVHLTDGDAGDPHSDCTIGTGVVDCPGVLRKLEEIDFDGRIILEVLSKEALIESMRFLEENGYMK